MATRFPMTGRGGYDPSKPAYDPRQPSVQSAARANLFPTAPVAAMAPMPVQFPVRSQMRNDSSYGAVSRRMGDEDKTGMLGGTARRRGAARSLLG